MNDRLPGSSPYNPILYKDYVIYLDMPNEESFGGSIMYHHKDYERNNSQDDRYGVACSVDRAKRSIDQRVAQEDDGETITYLSFMQDTSIPSSQRQFYQELLVLQGIVKFVTSGCKPSAYMLIDILPFYSAKKISTRRQIRGVIYRTINRLKGKVFILPSYNSSNITVYELTRYGEQFLQTNQHYIRGEAFTLPDYKL